NWERRRVMAIQGADLCRPRVGDAKIAARRASLHLALSVHDFRLHAKEWTRCRAGLEFGCARQWCDKDAASLGLPPSVDDWATIFADDVVEPFPGFRIDRLTHSAKKAQRFAGGFLYRIIDALHQGADRGRCSIDSGYLVLVAHLPEARSGRKVRHALEHH